MKATLSIVALTVLAVVVSLTLAIGAGSQPADATPEPGRTQTVIEGFLDDLVEPGVRVVDGMAGIPAGSFEMGCTTGDTECREDEKPAHRVTLRAFWIDQTEVTVEEYAKCVKPLKCREPGIAGGNPSPNLNFRKPDRGNHPVNGVGWIDAETYCRWVGKRLPTEAEWEYAARAGKAEIRHGDLDSIAWYMRNARGGTRPVKVTRPNAWWLYDMLGNVEEWVADIYDRDYYKRSPTENPTGPLGQMAGLRVLRGGSWVSLGPFLRVSSRAMGEPRATDDELGEYGFRCAKDR